MSTGDRSLVQALGPVGPVFFSSFEALRPSQRAAIMPVLSGQNVLLASPTASGKTEALIAPMVARVLSSAASRDRVRVLVIAPTRALVNDLHTRLEAPLSELRLRCGRQTSDHRLGDSEPFLVITTPESLDSMLARRTICDISGRPAGHLLDGVQAVFVDEAHLFDNSARGDQLQWLLGRLRRVCQLGRASGSHVQAPQVCAASATVSSPQELAARLLGPTATVLSPPGTRELLMFSGEADIPWHLLGDSERIDSVLNRVIVSSGAGGIESLSRIVWSAMSSPGEQLVRKLLVFVPSRSLCDELSTGLRQFLDARRQVEVYAHHGSLDKQLREAAEKGFGRARDSVLVATTTLEVGVDIGDVDAVVLIGPPADTNGLLQRIGRSGRRLGVTRVVAIARSAVDRLAMASMLLAARDGICDPQRYGRRWSVCVQQMSSFVRQGPSTGRRISDILQLAGDVWPDGGASAAKLVLEHLLSEGYLEMSRDGRVVFGDEWQGLWEAMGMHGNIDGASGGTPVIDATTGETVVHLPAGSRIPDLISIAGANWRVSHSGGEVLLRGIDVRGATSSIRYGARRAPVGRAFARHVALGLALTDSQMVNYCGSNGRFAFHFGGAVFERLLRSIDDSLEPAPGLVGIALRGRVTENVRSFVADIQNVTTLLSQCLQDSASLVAPGPYFKYLPPSVQALTLHELLPGSDFVGWINSRSLVDAEHGTPLATRLQEVFGWDVSPDVGSSQICL